jgi:Protein of unknown function (DUF3455)
MPYSLTVPGRLALGATEAGQFATVSLIRRVGTTGGSLPADKPCDAQHAGDQERVGYSATYLFYATK